MHYYFTNSTPFFCCCYSHLNLLSKFKLVYASTICSLGQKLKANAEDNSDELVDPPKVEDKIGAVPHGLSTDSDVAKRYINLYDLRSLFLWIDFVIWNLNLCE